MVCITGKYKHEKDTNIGVFHKMLGDDYTLILGMFSSELEVAEEDGEWLIETVTMDKIQTVVFMPHVPYDEIISGGAKLKSTTIPAKDTLITTSHAEDGKVIIRTYDFSKKGVILTMQIIGKPEVAMRHFKRMNTSKISPATLKKFVIGGTAAIVGGGVAVVAAPLVVAAAGFTSTGIAAGSIAASMMSVFGGGATAAGGAIATLQSVGALGTVLGSVAATTAAAGTGVVVGSAAGVGVAHAIVKDSEKK